MFTRVWFALALCSLPCLPVQAQDQQTLNRHAQEEFQQADKKLNTVYRQLLPRLTASEKERLTDAQLLWIQFRDSQARARAEIHDGGSIYPMIYESSRTRTTQARTSELQDWLEDLKQR